MKALVAAASAAVLVSGFPLAASAQQAVVPPGFYGNIGYVDVHSNGTNLGAIFGRLGYRFNPWLGAEGELAGGVVDDDIDAVVAPGIFATGKAKLSHSEAIYGVGFWPVAPNWELLGRVGYGHTEVKLEDLTAPGVGPFSVSADDNSWNFGVGAQYHWDGLNGIRADYTRHEYDGNDLDHADVWSIAYSRRF